MSRTPTGIRVPEGGFMSSLGITGENFWTGARRAGRFINRERGEPDLTTAERNRGWWAGLGGALLFGFMFGGGDIGTFLIAAIIGALVMPMIVGGMVGVYDGFAARGERMRGQAPEPVRQPQRRVEAPAVERNHEVGSAPNPQELSRVAAASGVEGQRFTVSDASGVPTAAAAGSPPRATTEIGSPGMVVGG